MPILHFKGGFKILTIADMGEGGQKCLKKCWRTLWTVTRSFKTFTETKLDLRSIDGWPANTVWGLQKENVTEEEARRVLDEIHFIYQNVLKSCNLLLKKGFVDFLTVITVLSTFDNFESLKTLIFFIHRCQSYRYLMWRLFTNRWCFFHGFDWNGSGVFMGRCRFWQMWTWIRSHQNTKNYWEVARTPSWKNILWWTILYGFVS